MTIDVMLVDSASLGPSRSIIHASPKLENLNISICNMFYHHNPGSDVHLLSQTINHLFRRDEEPEQKLWSFKKLQLSGLRSPGDCGLENHLDFSTLQSLHVLDSVNSASLFTTLANIIPPKDLRLKSLWVTERLSTVDTSTLSSFLECSTGLQDVRLVIPDVSNCSQALLKHADTLTSLVLDCQTGGQHLHIDDRCPELDNMTLLRTCTHLKQLGISFPPVQVNGSFESFADSVFWQYVVSLPEFLEVFSLPINEFTADAFH